MVIYIIPGMIYLAIFRSLLIWNWAIIMRNITANLPTLGGETRAFGGKRLQKVGNSLFSGGNPCRFPSSGLAVAVGVHVARAMMFLSVSTGKILWQCSNSCRGASTSWHVKEIMAVTNQLWVRWQKNDMLNVFRVFQGWCPNTTQVPVFEFLWCRDSTPKNSWYTKVTINTIEARNQHDKGTLW